MWQGRDAPLVRTDSLKEAYLGWLQGMRQGANPQTPKRHISSSIPTLTWGGGRLHTPEPLSERVYCHFMRAEILKSHQSWVQLLGRDYLLVRHRRPGMQAGVCEATTGGFGLPRPCSCIACACSFAYVLSASGSARL